MENRVFWNGRELAVRGGQWADEMNSCFYTVIDNQSVRGFLICRENGNGDVFALRGTLADEAGMKKEIDLGHGVTKTVTRRFLRRDEDNGRAIFAAPETDYTKNGVTVRVVESAGNVPWGRENAYVFVLGSSSPTRTYKHKANAHAKAFELLTEIAR